MTLKIFNGLFAPVQNEVHGYNVLDLDSKKRRSIDIMLVEIEVERSALPLVCNRDRIAYFNPMEINFGV